MAIISGIIGLGGIALAEAPSTAENASLMIAKVAIIMAYVLIPCFIARALEYVTARPQTKLLKPPLKLEHHRFFEPQASQTEESYFDYFFLPDSAHDWQVMQRDTKQKA
jgi:hypothetical protein